MQDKNHLIKLAADRKKIPLEQAEKEINAIFEEKKDEYPRRLALAHYFVDQIHPNHNVPSDVPSSEGIDTVFNGKE